MFPYQFIVSGDVFDVVDIMADAYAQAGEPSIGTRNASETRSLRVAGATIIVGTLALFASLAMALTLPGEMTLTEYVTHPLLVPIVAVDFVAFTMITVGAIYLARALAAGGEDVSMIVAVVGVGAAYVLGLAELALRGIAAPTMAEELTDPATLETTIQTYAAFGGGLTTFMFVLHGAVLALIGYALYRSELFHPAIGLVGVAIGVVNLVVVSVDFLGAADVALVGFVLTIVLYVYLLALGAVSFRSGRANGDVPSST